MIECSCGAEAGGVHTFACDKWGRAERNAWKREMNRDEWKREPRRSEVPECEWCDVNDDGTHN